MARQKKELPIFAKQSHRHKTHEFTFRRGQNPTTDWTPIIKRGVVYVHSWGTGYQELVFEDHERAERWWEANKAYLDAKKPELIGK